MVLRFEDHHVFRLLKGGVETHETNRMALRREIRDRAGLKEFTIVGALGTYAYLAEDGFSVLVNVYLVHCSMFATETSEKAFWLRTKDAISGLQGNERSFLMNALGISQPQPAVMVITAERKAAPPIHFLRNRFNIAASPSLSASRPGKIGRR